MKNLPKISSFTIVFFSLYQIYLKTILKEHNELQLTHTDHLRSLSQLNNSIWDNNNKTNHQNPLSSFRPIEHEFILNITQYPYQGKWTSFRFPGYQFANSKGKVEYSLTKGYIQTKQFNTNASTSMLLSLLIKDGEYIDRFFMANISFIFPNILSQILLSTTKYLRPFTISAIPCLVSHFNGDFFEKKGNTMINSTVISITFFPIESIITDSSNLSSSRILWSKLEIDIEDKNNGILIELNSTMHNPNDKRFKVFNYSMVIFLIAIFQICSSVTLLLDINENNHLCCNIDLITLSLQIFYNALLCSYHFFLTVSNEKYAVNFGLCSIAYFILFSVFELHILFCCWKARFNHLIYTDVILFRKKLIQFYVLFYLILFSSMISLSFWFNHFGLSFLVFSSCWLFQIMHSVTTSTRPPMSYEYILWFTIGKVICPLYIKGCPYNVFELKPEYLKIYSIALMSIAEGCIVIMQKCLGPKFFIPQCFRKNTFSYYKDFNELIDKTNECVICLEPLKNKDKIINYIRIDNDKSINGKINKEQLIDNMDDCIYKLVLKIVNNYKQEKPRKDYMATPCFHEFHTLCLEKWIECKSECPYCRRILPSLDD